MTANRLLSIIKVFSLTTGIISFLLICLFYFDTRIWQNNQCDASAACTGENLILPGTILLLTSMIYFFVMKSQLSLRQKELFWRKYYGESRLGLVVIFMIETSVYILISFTLSLILLDLLAPFFNFITQKDIDLSRSLNGSGLVLSFIFLSFLGLITGFLPSVWYARHTAKDILKKLP